MDTKFVRLLKLIGVSATVVALLVMIWALFVPLMQYRDGGPVINSDEFYMALCCRDYAGSPLGMLTFYTGYWWSRLCGDSILSFRVLSLLFTIIPLLITILIFNRATRRSELTWLLLALTLFGSIAHYENVYDWNCGPNIYLVGAAVGLLFLFRQPSLAFALLTGILLGLAAASRLPLLVLWPISIILTAIRFRHEPSTILRISAPLLIGSVMVFLAIVWIVYGSWGAFTNAVMTEGIISGHSRLSSYWWSLKYLTPIIMVDTMPMVLTLIGAAFLRRTNFSRFWKVFTLLLIALLGWFTANAAYNFTTALSAYRLICFGLLYGIFAIYSLSPWVYNHLRGSKRIVPEGGLVCIVCWIFAASMCVGSDVTLVRFYIFPFLPLIMIGVARHFPRFSTYTLTALVVSCGLFAIKTRVVNTLPSVERGDNYADIPRLYPIFNGSKYAFDKDIIRQWRDDYHSLEAKYGSVLVWGQDKYILHYLELDHTPAGNNCFHADELYAPRHKRLLDKELPHHNAAMLIGHFQPQYLTDYLLSNGFTLVKQTDYAREFVRVR